MVNVAIIGCGLIGQRRAKEVVDHPDSTLKVVVDLNPEAAQRVATLYGCQGSSDWRSVLGQPDIQAIVVATYNSALAEIAIAALGAGHHVLVEKPMGRNVAEAIQMAAAAQTAQRVLKIGFNHRYHPAIAQAHQLYTQGHIGDLINLRARYGHGGRPGYEKEWRGNPELAGGGELTDQGVHIADLIQWFAGRPEQAFAYLQTAIWPIQPLEDNGFGLFRYANGVVASLHTSWTQWKNLFSFELYGQKGSLTIEGLGGSYGTERLTIARRQPAGGAPELEEICFDQPDDSWQREWQDFLGAVAGHSYLGNPQEGVAAMQMVEALYRSAKAGTAIQL